MLFVINATICWGLKEGSEYKKDHKMFSIEITRYGYATAVDFWMLVTSQLVGMRCRLSVFLYYAPRCFDLILHSW